MYKNGDMRMLKEKKSVSEIIYILVFIILGVLYFCFANSIAGLAGDGGDGHYAIWTTNAKMLHNGELPLWNPYIWGGYSDVGHIHGVFYPILIVLEYLFWDKSSSTLMYSIFPAYAAIHFIIGCIGMYVLGRIRKKKAIVSFAVSFLVMFTGSFIFGRKWAYIFGGYSWIIWLILFLYLLVETGRVKYILYSGIVLAMIGLCASAQGVLFAVLIYILLFFVVLGQNIKDVSRWGNIVLKFLASGFIGLGIASVELLPFLETTINSYRYIPGVDVGENVKKVPIHLFKTDIVDSNEIMQLMGGYEGVLAISCVSFILILLSFFIRYEKNEWFPIFARVLMIGSFMYSCGFAIADLFWYIPGYNAIRQPILYAPFVVIGGGILMLDSLEMVYECISKKSKCTINEKICNCNLCIGLLLASICVIILPHLFLHWPDIVIKMLLLIAIMILITKRKISDWIITMGLLIICACNYCEFFVCNISSNWYNTNSANQKIMDVHSTTSQLFEELNNKVKDGEDISARYMKWSPINVLPANEAGVIGEKDCFAYLNPIYEKTFYFYQLADMKVRVQLQNIKYVLYSADSEDSFKEWIEGIFEKEGNVAETKVYPSYDDTEKKVVNYIDTSELNLGCGWIANNVIMYSEAEDAYDYNSSLNLMNMINNPDTNLKKDVFVDKDSMDLFDSFEITSEKDVEYSVECISYKPNSIDYYITCDQDGIFVTTEYDYPGWHVIIDGEKADILQINYAFRGAYLPEGNHMVSFYYMPTSLIGGGGLAVMAVLIAVFVNILEKRRGTEWILFRDKVGVKKDKHGLM